MPIFHPKSCSTMVAVYGNIATTRRASPPSMHSPKGGSGWDAASWEASAHPLTQSGEWAHGVPKEAISFAFRSHVPRPTPHHTHTHTPTHIPPNTATMIHSSGSFSVGVEHRRRVCFIRGLEPKSVGFLPRPGCAVPGPPLREERIRTIIASTFGHNMSLLPIDSQSSSQEETFGCIGVVDLPPLLLYSWTIPSPCFFY